MFCVNKGSGWQLFIIVSQKSVLLPKSSSFISGTSLCISILVISRLQIKLCEASSKTSKTFFLSFTERQSYLGALSIMLLVVSRNVFLTVDCIMGFSGYILLHKSNAFISVCNLPPQAIITYFNSLLNNSIMAVAIAVSTKENQFI